MGKGGKAGDLFTDGLNNPDAFKLSPHSDSICFRGGGSTCPRGRSVIATELSDYLLDTLGSLCLEMEGLPHRQCGNAPDYEGPGLLVHTRVGGESLWSPTGSRGHLLVLPYPVIAENKQLRPDKGKVTKGSDPSEKKVWITKLEINQANQSSSQERGTLE